MDMRLRNWLCAVSGVLFAAGLVFADEPSGSVLDPEVEVELSVLNARLEQLGQMANDTTEPEAQEVRVEIALLQERLEQCELEALAAEIATVEAKITDLEATEELWAGQLAEVQ